MVLLNARPHSDLPHHDTIDSLLASPEDGICFLHKAAARRPPPYLQDSGPQAYVMKLVNPLLVPQRAIRRNLHFLRTATQWALGLPTSELPAGLAYGKADLLVTADNHIVADSFSRAVIVHPSLALGGKAGWHVPLPGPENMGFLDDRLLYLELVPGHFGHMVVDMPRRLWVLNEPGLAAVKGLNCVAFASHGLILDQGLPPIAARLLAAMGVSPDLIHLADRPVRVRELIVPGRISPHRGPGGPRYGRLMAEAGRRLAKGQIGNAAFVFLSRSKLSQDRRPVEAAFAKQIDALFGRSGFRVVHPQELDLGEQIAIVRGASHLAGFGGSQLHLAAFSQRRGLKLLRLCQDDYVTRTDRAILTPLEGQVVDVMIQGQRRPKRFRFSRPLRPDSQDLARIEAAILDFIVDAPTIDGQDR